MVAILNDVLFASEPGKRPQIAKLAEQHSSGTNSFVMESLDGWADQCSFVVYEVDTDGNPILGSETDWVGIRSGRTIQNAAKTAGIDRDYPASRTYVIATETAGARNRLIRALFNTINENGHLKHEIIDYSHIKNKSITKEKLVDRCVVSEKLGLKSVGSAELKDGAVKANNIDWATIKRIPKYGPSGSLITSDGVVSSTTTYTATSDGFLTGKAMNLGANGSAGLYINGCVVGGVPYTNSPSMIQAGFLIPLAKGQEIEFRVDNGKFEQVAFLPSVF